MKLQGGKDRVSFTGVTFRSFLLHADFNRLQMFCNNYLNFPDDPPGPSSGNYFKAAAPWVTFSVINYGKMSTETENLGWIAQHEVLFSVPVEWYKVGESGELVFHDWAYVCPFIFVDNDRSLGVGREVYGWTKVRGWIRHDASTWTVDPREPRRLLSLDAELFPDLYAGESQEPRTLIDVVQDAPINLFRNPLGTDDPGNPWWSASRNLRRTASVMNDAFQFMSGIPIFGYSGKRHAGTAVRMAERLARNAMNGLSWLQAGNDTREAAIARNDENPASPYMNNLTLKQFRDAEEPDIVCYQALVNSRITIERIGDSGLLGGASLMMGDITGGYRIHVHEYAEQPIVDTLGLEVSETLRDEWGKKVAVLTPVLPSWMACDLRYDTGTTLCWRSKDSGWFDGDDRPIQSTRTANASEGVQPAGARPGNRFNTTRGAAIQSSAGPFQYPDTTVRVFPLMADKPRLNSFVDELLNDLKKPGDDSTRFSEMVREFELEMDKAKMASLAGVGPDHVAPSMDGTETSELRRSINALIGKSDDFAKAYAQVNFEEHRFVLDDKARRIWGARENTLETALDPGSQRLPGNIELNQLTPDGSNVYMVVTTYGKEIGKMYNEWNNLGETARREVSFFVPVNWYSWDEAANRVQRRRVFITPFVFCDSMRHVLSDVEVNGVPAIHSIIQSDDDWWLRESGPHATRKVLATLRTLLMPALHTGQPSEFREIMKVIDGKIDAALPENPDAKCSLLEIKRSIADSEGLAALLERPGAYFDSLYLKQYRAAKDIKNHCYQGLVLVRKRVDYLVDETGRYIADPNQVSRKPIDGHIHVSLESYPSLPIASRLGIKVASIDSRKDTVQQQILPVNPFVVRLGLRESLGVNLYSRVRGQDWSCESREISC